VATAGSQAALPAPAALLSMIDFSCNHYALFGLPERYRFDAVQLDTAYRTLQVEVHPDRHTTGDAAAQRSALQASARVNEAYRTLKDPVARAEYLLQLMGVDAVAPADTALPLAFLERQLERREAAEDAAGARDEPRLEALLREVRADAREIEARLAVLLDVDAAWDGARTPVRELRFLSKLDADLEAMIGAVGDQ
jgi:molecular chaperone HscB